MVDGGLKEGRGIPSRLAFFNPPSELNLLNVKGGSLEDYLAEVELGTPGSKTR
jgi:hypothetical protein